MQLQFTRVARLGAVALASVAFAGIGASSASAVTIRQGTSTNLPTSASSSLVVPNGNFVGTQQILGSASFTSPTTSVGNCTNGQTSGRLVSGNGAATVNFDTASLFINACTDNNPNFDLQQITLTSPTTFTVTGSAPGQLNLVAPTFTVRIIDVNTSLVSNCAVKLYPPSGTGTLVGALNNGSPAGGAPNTTNTSSNTEPKLTFTNVRAYATASSGVCPQQIGNGSSTAQSSTFSIVFRGLRTASSATGLTTSANYIGSF